MIRLNSHIVRCKISRLHYTTTQLDHQLFNRTQMAWQHGHSNSRASRKASRKCCVGGFCFDADRRQRSLKKKKKQLMTSTLTSPSQHAPLCMQTQPIMLRSTGLFWSARAKNIPDESRGENLGQRRKDLLRTNVICRSMRGCEWWRKSIPPTVLQWPLKKISVCARVCVCMRVLVWCPCGYAGVLLSVWETLQWNATLRVPP